MVPPGCVLSGGTVPPGGVLSGGTVPPGCVLSGGTVPPVCVLSGGTVPPFNLSQLFNPIRRFIQAVKMKKRVVLIFWIIKFDLYLDRSGLPPWHLICGPTVAEPLCTLS